MSELTRRDLLGLMGITAAAVAGQRHQPHRRIPKPHPANASKAFHAPDTRKIALTIDDGYDAETVAAYVRLCQDTGLHLTFNPVGSLASTWKRHADALRPLIEQGQVQIGNHTYHHRILLPLSDSQIRDEIERNESWIERTFGITARPYFRPPGGIHDDRTDGICSELGYSRILLWQGSFEDSVPTNAEHLLAAAEEALHPGAVILGHANQPTVIALFSQILALIDERRLESATLDELFGTSRQTG